MDPVLSTQYPIHQIGSDGLSWWVGQVESYADGDSKVDVSDKDPKRSGRYRVRIIGRHLKDCNVTPTSQLPWASCMMPVTQPWSDGQKTGGSIGLTVGSWVMGIYLDNDQQKPLIIGSIGHTAGATLLKNVEKDPNPAGTCKSFTTFLDTSANPNTSVPLSNEEKRNSLVAEGEPSGDTTGNQAAGSPPGATDKPPAALLALLTGKSEANPTGTKFCVEVANPKCGSEQDLPSEFERILGEMFKVVQQSDGQIGNYLVSKANGTLQSNIAIGRKYINKAIKIVTTFIAKIKGEIIAGIRDGIESLIKFTLYYDPNNKPDEKAKEAQGQVGPDGKPLPKKPKKPPVKRLQEVQDWINDTLSKIGCEMEDLTDRISKFITDTIFGFLFDAYTAAICLVDTLVAGVIQQIVNFIDTTLATILGPVNEILGIAAGPLNLIGGLIAKVLDILGISCDGLPAKCAKTKKVCVDCGKEDKTIDDWIDDLLDNIEGDGDLDFNTYVCKEAITDPPPLNTAITFYGGIPVAVQTQNQDGTPGEVVASTQLIQYTSENIVVTEGEEAIFNIVRSGDVSKSSSIKVKVTPKTADLDVDFAKKFDGSILGFAPYETNKTIKFLTFKDKEYTEPTENFFIRIEPDTTPDGYKVNFPTGKDFECLIKNTVNIPVYEAILPDPDDDTPLPFIPSANEIPVTIVLPDQGTGFTTFAPKFSVIAERTFYFEGETAVFNLKGVNTSEDVEYSYLISGVNEDDIVGGQLSGIFTVNLNGEATISIPLAENNDNIRIDPPGTVPVLDENGDAVLDEEGNVVLNEEEIITELDDLDEYLTLTVLTTNDSGFTLIKGEINEDPYYNILTDQTVYNEGDTVNVTITTVNVPEGTEGSYTISGDVEANDFDTKKLTGEFTIDSTGKATFPLGIVIDDDSEGTQLVTISIDNEDASVVFYINQDSLASEPEVDPPSYSVSTDKLEYLEGEVIEYTISTANVPDGTVFQWALLGVEVTPSDFVGNKVTGTFVVNNGEAKVYVGIADDGVTETAETVNFVISGTDAFASIIILGQDEIPTEQDPDLTPISVVDPCLDKPVAGDPITDETGSIISIPIIDSGCPYLEPPIAIVTGDGFGAAAIPLLDDTGRVTELRITRAGTGYTPNTSANANVICVVDSFTLLNPGKGYTSAPTVIVDGKEGIAEAEIDSRGYVTSVKILDRSIEFTSLPKVRIQGGGGTGAKFLPSIVCLDTLDELAASGYAKIGTGKYIDCP